MSYMKTNLLLLFSLGLIGCGPINSQFSCNATAKDSCLTIEQVEAMTHFANGSKPTHFTNKRKRMQNTALLNDGRVVKQDNGQSIWLASNVKDHSWA